MSDSRFVGNAASGGNGGTFNNEPVPNDAGRRDLFRGRHIEHQPYAFANSNATGGIGGNQDQNGQTNGGFARIRAGRWRLGRRRERDRNGQALLQARPRRAVIRAQAATEQIRAAMPRAVASTAWPTRRSTPRPLNLPLPMAATAATPLARRASAATLPVTAELHAAERFSPMVER